MVSTPPFSCPSRCDPACVSHYLQWGQTWVLTEQQKALDGPCRPPTPGPGWGRGAGRGTVISQAGPGGLVLAALPTCAEKLEMEFGAKSANIEMNYLTVCCVGKAKASPTPSTPSPTGPHPSLLVSAHYHSWGAWGPHRPHPLPGGRKGTRLAALMVAYQPQPHCLCSCGIVASLKSRS